MKHLSTISTESDASYLLEINCIAVAISDEDKSNRGVSRTRNSSKTRNDSVEIMKTCK